MVEGLSSCSVIIRIQTSESTVQTSLLSSLQTARAAAETLMIYSHYQLGRFDWSCLISVWQRCNTIWFFFVSPWRHFMLWTLKSTDTSTMLSSYSPLICCWIWQDLIGGSLIVSSETWNNTGTVCVLHVGFFSEMKVLAVFHLILQTLPGWTKSCKSFGSDTLALKTALCLQHAVNITLPLWRDA